MHHRPVHVTKRLKRGPAEPSRRRGFFVSARPPCKHLLAVPILVAIDIGDTVCTRNGLGAVVSNRILTLDVDTLMGAGQMRINCQIPLVFRLLPGVPTRSC